METENKPTFAANPIYRDHERLFKELHDLIRQGKNESEEADAVREKMEEPWYELSEPEQERLSGLSADLYSLSGEEKPTNISFAEECKLHIAINTAFENKQWEEALSLLRKGPQMYAPNTLATRRARCWYELGHFQAACWFYGHATCHNR